MHLGISSCQYLLQVVLPERLGEKPQLPTHVQKATAKAFAFDACVDGRASQVSSRANECGTQAVQRPPFSFVCLNC